MRFSSRARTRRMSHDSVARIDHARTQYDPFDELSPEAARSAARNLTRRTIELQQSNERLGRDNDVLRAIHLDQQPEDRERIQVLWPEAALDFKPVPQLVSGL